MTPVEKASQLMGNHHSLTEALHAAMDYSYRYDEGTRLHLYWEQVIRIIRDLRDDEIKGGAIQRP